MADIDVVKKGSSSWVWILAVLAAVVLIWLLWSSTRSEDAAGSAGPRSHQDTIDAVQLSRLGVQPA